MRQKSFSSGFEKHHKQTRKERFLSEMDQVLPWKPLVEALAPYYPDPQGVGRRAIGLQRMLRIYFMQHWYSLSDPAMEEALYDSRAMREFAGIDLGDEPAPDESTILQFRHLMEAHDFGAEFTTPSPPSVAALATSSRPSSCKSCKSPRPTNSANSAPSASMAPSCTPMPPTPMHC